MGLFSTPTSNFFSLILYISIRHKDQHILVHGDSIFIVNIIFKDNEIAAPVHLTMSVQNYYFKSRSVRRGLLANPKGKAKETVICPSLKCPGVI